MSDDLRKIEVGEKILGFFVVRKIEQRVKEGQHYLSLEVGNSSGRINGTYWGDDAQELYKVLSQGSVVKIMGEGMEYGGKSWLSIQKIRLAEPNEVEIEQLLPKGRYSSDVLWKQIEKYINLLEDEWLKKLVTSIFYDSKFRDKFLTYPAAKLWHGAYLGGLAEHTLRVTAVCKRVSEFYSPCRHDLLICGALLHDIGKVKQRAETKPAIKRHQEWGAEWLDANGLSKFREFSLYHHRLSQDDPKRDMLSIDRSSQSYRGDLWIVFEADNLSSADEMIAKKLHL